MPCELDLLHLADLCGTEVIEEFEARVDFLRVWMRIRADMLASGAKLVSRVI